MGSVCVAISSKIGPYFTHIYKYSVSLLFLIFVAKLFTPLFISSLTGWTIPIAVVLFVLPRSIFSTFGTLRRCRSFVSFGSLSRKLFFSFFLSITFCAVGNCTILRLLLLWQRKWNLHHHREARHNWYWWSWRWCFSRRLSYACLTDRILG